MELMKNNNAAIKMFLRLLIVLVFIFVPYFVGITLDYIEPLMGIDGVPVMLAWTIGTLSIMATISIYILIATAIKYVVTGKIENE